MICVRAFAFAVVAISLLRTPVTAFAAEDAPVVHLSGGELRGYFQGASAVFKGIPYAAPPVGKLRWREPQPAAPWAGIRDATKAAQACPQNKAGLDGFVKPLAAAYGVAYNIEPVSSSEDCLYLNVWTPAWPVRRSLPVMVWVHGGANLLGSGSQTTYDGSSLASRGVTVVTINYRLGVLGFFSHPELTAESPHRASGNYGLLDQIAALRWVQANIAQFGGDPRNVTVFGESAGSIDTGLLLTSPLAKGLFRRAILQSGPAFGMGKALDLWEAEAAGAAIGRAASGPPTTPLANLRKLPAAELLKLADAQSNGSYSVPVTADGWVLPQSPARAFATGKIANSDLLIGMNGREMSAFRVGAATKPKVQHAVRRPPSKGLRTLVDAARPLYGAWTYPTILRYLGEAFTDREKAVDHAGNDMLMACPLGAMAALARAEGRTVFAYRFERSIPGKGEAVLGAMHGLDIPYVFNAFNDRAWRWLPFTEVDRKLSDWIQTYWTNFAKTGDPNSSNVPVWARWTNGREDYLRITRGAVFFHMHRFSPIHCDLSVDRLRRDLAR